MCGVKEKASIIIIVMYRFDREEWMERSYCTDLDCKYSMDKLN